MRNAREWNADAGLTDPQLTTETAWLDRHGFVGGVREVLARENRSAAQIDSIVEEFGSGSAAGAELADRYAQAERTGQTLNRRFTPFDVPRIPGAVGYDTAAPDALGHTVAFASGDFYYRVDSSAPPRDRFAPSRARVISAAVALYERMRAGGPV